MKTKFYNLIFILLLSYILACNHPYEKNEILGTYIANKYMRTRDTIIFIDTINYIHFGINSQDKSKYSDTAKWDYDGKFNCVSLHDFRSQTSRDKKLKAYRSIQNFDIEKQDGMLSLVVGRDAGWYYVRNN
jgi:superfamily II DNA/RNA helicase